MNGVRLRPLFGGFTVTVLAAGALCLAVGIGFGIANYRDVGYPDSADVLTVGELVHSGHLYPDFTRPPYLVTLYGPLTYLVPAAPYALAQTAGVTPQIFLRLAEVFALLVCLWLVYRVAHRLYRSRSVAWVSVLFAASAAAFASWTTQIRGDLPAVAVSLFAIYLALRAERPSQTVTAAAAAGLALLTKQTFCAAAIAIVLWLLTLRRFKDAAVCAIVTCLTVAFGYAIVLWREPLGLKHLAAIAHPTLNPAGAGALLLEAALQPVTPFAVLGAVLVLRKASRGGLLVLFYCAAAWLVAILTILQAGANFNYFWEPLVCSALLAGPQFCELQHKTSRISRANLAIFATVLCGLLIPALLHDFYYLRRLPREIRAYQGGKAKWQSFAAAVSGKRLLSTFPDVAVLSSSPEMPDPFLNTLLERHGAWDPRPVIGAIDAGAYDLIVIGPNEAAAPRNYRGFPLWSESIWKAVRRSYKPGCAFDEMEAWLPKASPGSLPQALLAIGCEPVAAREN
jgi:hypothetical protein